MATSLAACSSSAAVSAERRRSKANTNKSCTAFFDGAFKRCFRPSIGNKRVIDASGCPKQRPASGVHSELPIIDARSGNRESAETPIELSRSDANMAHV